MASSVPTFKAKVCLIGEEAVGKSSLIRRFVTNEFAGQYIKTLGTQITKKEVNFHLPNGRTIHVDFTLWDIMGQKGFMDLVGEAYFYKAGAVFAVCDGTRPETFQALREWLSGVRRLAGPLPGVVAINKCDLKHRIAITQDQVDQLSRDFDVSAFYTSAKSGEGVPEAFEALARKMLQSKGLLVLS